MGRLRSARRKHNASGARAALTSPSAATTITTTATPAIPANDLSPGGASAFDPATEYVAGYGLGYSALERFLPPQRHDANAPEVTFDTYRLMLNDPEVGSGVRTLVAMALADGLQISPAIEGRAIDEDAPDYARAVEIAEHTHRSLAGLRRSLDDCLEGIIEGALLYGHKAAEVTWRAGTGPDRDRLVLDRIAQKDHRTLEFVVDQFWNHLGFRSRSAASRETIPREKFLLLALHEEDEDPRGRSSIRSAYTSWTFKQLCWPEYKRWLDNCALPTVVGKTAPKQPGDVQRNADGTKKEGGRILSPAEAMAQAFAGLKSAGYIVVPPGSEVSQLDIVDDGAGFERAIAVADGQIAKAILYQTLATGEAQFGTRAQSETHMSVLDLLVAWLKSKVAAAIERDLVRTTIRWNFGEEALVYTPQISLGDTERRDWSVDAAAAAALEPAVTDSQWNAITDQLGLPQPLPGEQPRRTARTEAVQTPAPPAPGPAGRVRSRPGAFITMTGRLR